MTFDVGTRVVVVDRGDRHCGEYGTVVRAEHQAILTGRPMIEVRLDEKDETFDEGYYLEQIEPVRVKAAVA